MFLILFIYLKFSNLNVKTSGSNQVSPEIWSEQCSTGFFSYRTVLIWSLLCLFFFFFPNHKNQNCGLHLMISSSPIAFPLSHVSSPVGGWVCVYMCVCTFFPLSMHSPKYPCIWKSQVGPFKDVILFILDFLYPDIVMVCSPLEILNSWISVRSIPDSL